MLIDYLWIGDIFTKLANLSAYGEKLELCIEQIFGCNANLIIELLMFECRLNRIFSSNVHISNNFMLIYTENVSNMVKKAYFLHYCAHTMSFQEIKRKEKNGWVLNKSPTENYADTWVNFAIVHSCYVVKYTCRNGLLVAGHGRFFTRYGTWQDCKLLIAEIVKVWCKSNQLANAIGRCSKVQILVHLYQKVLFLSQ